MNEPFKYDEKTKQKFTDALQHCLNLMNENNKTYQHDLNYSSNNILTRRSALTGYQMYEFFKEIIKKEIIEPDTEKIKLKRASVKLKRLDPGVMRKLRSKKNKSVSIDNDDVETRNKLKAHRKLKKIHLSQKKKLEIINMIRENPSWSMRTIREKSGCPSCQSYQIKRWIDMFKKGGSGSKPMNMINRYVYGKYIHFKKKNKQITDKDLTKWAGEAIAKYNIKYSKKFTVQRDWLGRFKRIYCLSVPTNAKSQDDDHDDSDDSDESE